MQDTNRPDGPRLAANRTPAATPSCDFQNVRSNAIVRQAPSLQRVGHKASTPFSVIAEFAKQCNRQPGYGIGRGYDTRQPTFVAPRALTKVLECKLELTKVRSNAIAATTHSSPPLQRPRARTDVLEWKLEVTKVRSSATARRPPPSHFGRRQKTRPPERAPSS